MKANSTLLFQSLLSFVLFVFAGLIGIAFFTSAHLSRPDGPLDPSRNLVVTDRAEWRQFYDSVVGSEPKAEVARPAEPVPEQRAADDAVEVPTATRVPDDQAPSASVAPTASTTMPIAPQSPPGELAAKTDGPSAQPIAPPDAPQDKGFNTTVSNRDQAPPETAPSVGVSENASPALAKAPVPLRDENEASAPTTPLPAVRSVTTPRPKVVAPAQPVHSAPRVKRAAQQPEREPAERSRPSAPSRARVAVPRQGSAPQPDGPPWVDPQNFGPQQQAGALSYAPPQNNALPPGGPQFGPYFPYGSTPPPARRSRTQQSRSSQPPDDPRYDSRQTARQPAPRQPAQTYNDPYGWR